MPLSHSLSANAVTSRAGVEIIRLGGSIGAEIRGVDLTKPLTSTQVEVMRDALVRHEVIVLRGQDVTVEQQMAFGRHFGELSVHPFSPNLDDKREVIELDYSAHNPPALTDQWHSDETFRMAPPMATILRAKVVPEYGGDTLFSSMTAAYTGLSERMKQYIHGLEALHDFKPFRSLFTSSESHQVRLRELEDEFPNPWHPVVRVHPVSGRRILNVNPQFTLHLKGLKEDEGRTILQFLYDRAKVPEYQLRVRWAPHTVVMWDNRSVQHYAPHDYFPQRRTMQRITIAGEPVIGVKSPYVPEEGAAPLSDRRAANRKPAREGSTREFERR